MANVGSMWNTEKKSVIGTRDAPFRVTISGLPERMLASVTLAVCSLLVLLGCGIAQRASSEEALPARFTEHRIHVHPVTAGGDTLELYADTGGSYFLYRPTVEELGLPVRDTVLRGHSYSVTTFPDIAHPPSFPRVKGAAPLVRRRRPVDRKIHPDIDGMLGQSWFAGRVWRIDYIRKEMTAVPHNMAPDTDAEHSVAMGFRTDSTGRRLSNYPSISITVAGKTYPVLLDTGATFWLSEKGRSVLGAPRVRGGSYIIASVFRKWQEEHPNWRVIEGGGMYGGGTEMIRVPSVTIAGHSVGPVWFSKRPDKNFRQTMAQYMDRPVDGAAGGSLFQYFRVTLDYPNARAHFRRGWRPPKSVGSPPPAFQAALESRQAVLSRRE